MDRIEPPTDYHPRVPHSSLPDHISGAVALRMKRPRR